MNIATVATSSVTDTDASGRPSSTTNSTETTPNHTSGGIPAKEQSVNDDDAGQRAQQVEAVGVQPRKLREAVGHELARTRHDGGHRAEDHRQRHPDRRPASCAGS